MKLSTLKFAIPDDDEDYTFHSSKMKYRRTSACLEGNFMEQINFFYTLYKALIDVIDT
jgi:hypothetical protein